MNELVGLAKGDFVVTLASDDMLVRGGIRARLEYLARNPSKHAVFGDALVIDGDERRLLDSAIADLFGGNKRRLVLGDRALLSELVFRWCVPGPVLLVAREVYSTVGRYDEKLAVEDFDFYLRLAARGLLGFIDVPVAEYRWHQNSASARFRADEHKEWFFMTVKKNRSLVHGIPGLFLHAMYQRLRAQRAGAVLARRPRYFMARSVEKALAWWYATHSGARSFEVAQRPVRK